MFEFLHKKKDSELALYNPVFGAVKELATYPDEAFASGALGLGLSIEPTSGIVKAPFSGKVTALMDTHHAIGLTSEDGVEVLIHIGVDTVELNGKFFESKVALNDEVSLGQELLTFDIPKIQEAGYKVTVAFVILNEKREIHYSHVGETLEKQEIVMRIEK